jgi:hypothetical protein
MSDKLIDAARSLILGGEEEDARFEDVEFKGVTYRVIQCTLEERSLIQEKSGLMDSIGKGKAKVNLARQAIAAAIVCTRARDCNGQWKPVFDWPDFEKLCARRAGGIEERLGTIAVRLMGGGASSSPELLKVAEALSNYPELGTASKNNLRKAVLGHLGAPPLVEVLQNILNTDQIEKADHKLRDQLQAALDGVEGMAAAKNDSTAISVGVSGSPMTGEERPTSGAEA